MCWLDPILNRLPAWRAFFIEPWSAITMTPEKHTQATQLEQRHRQLTLELKQWQAQAETPRILSDPFTSSSVPYTAVPIDLWLAFKNGMVKHLQALIAKNREQFDKL